MAYLGGPQEPGREAVNPDATQLGETLRTINYVAQGLTIVFVTAFVATRVYAKSTVLGGGLSLDDCATYIAYVLLMGFCASSCFASSYGGGLDMSAVPSGNMPSFLKSCYAASILYMPMALCVKLALLLIIIRVFGIVHRKTLIGMYCLIAVLCAFYCSGFFVKIFVCWPISAYWHGDESKCLDHGAIIIADTIMSVLSDLVILLLPVPLTWSLQLPRKKKLRVSGMLCAGGVATAFSIYRFELILHELRSRNVTVVFMKLILSGNAEVGIGLICACFPAVNTLYLQMTNGGSSYLKQTSRSRRTASQAGEIVLTRSFHVDSTSLSNCVSHNHDELEMGSRGSRQHSQAELHYKYGHSINSP
ncbi:hypothetical protein E4U42_007392 [Claviceps africana]|uniref:Rhodopsin domain-containing protein n=1 Tax=Claviceps africana TaxID=83212 RepID=A0A8K0JBH8_9HYPO|nr:hypothetical protein E4U42_007392 [Claviceps africana]